MAISLHTANCIQCGRKAVQWTGHVTANSYGPIRDDGKMPLIEIGIIAGFCDSRVCASAKFCMDQASSDKRGCYGKWHDAHGILYTPGEQSVDSGIVAKVANEDFVTIELSTLQGIHEKAGRNNGK